MLDNTYWSKDFPHPLSPSNSDVEIYKSYLSKGTTLLLGCTKNLIPISDYQMDIDPWYKGPSMIVQDWLTNKNYYSNIILDGGLCFNKKLCDGILDMASNHCNVFIARSFNYKLPTMRIAEYFPKSEDFQIKPTDSKIFNDYSFFVWKF
jgi:hypothetical protein